MKKFFSVLPAIAIVVVAIYFVITTSPHVRLWVDDFCSATRLRNDGFIGAQIAWWNGWTGRYSFIALLDLFESLGRWSTMITPIIISSLLIVSLLPTIGLLLSSLFTVLVLVNAPNIIQSFYWQMGVLNYTAPFILLNLFLSILITKLRKVSLVVPFVLLLISGGFSEPFALAQIILLAFIIIGILIIHPKEKSRTLKILVAGLLGATLSLVIMMLSPGNAARQQTVTHPESMMFVIKSAILGTKWYLLRFLTIKPFVYSLLIIFSSVYLFEKKYVFNTKKSILVMAVSILGAIFTTMAVVGSGFYSMSILPPQRALFIAVYTILLCFLVFSFALSSLIRNVVPTKRQHILYWGIILLNILTSFVLLKSMILDWGKVRNELESYATEFDRIEPMLIESEGEDVEIKNIKAVGELDSFTDNKGWVASCLAGYYGLKSVRIVE